MKKAFKISIEMKEQILKRVKEEGILKDRQIIGQGYA